MPEDPATEIKDFAAEALSMPREPIQDHLDEYEHFGNRRLRTVGELIQEAFRIGLYRMERVVRERLTTEDADTITPQTIVNIRPVVAALKEFFGSSQLSPVHGPDQLPRGPDPPPPPVGARRRRPDPRARADRGARRAPDPLRPHVPDRDPGGSEHRPDRLALVLRGDLRARLRRRRPYRVVKDGKVTDEIVRSDATQEEERTIAQANTPVDEKGSLLGDEILCRTQAGQYVTVPAGRRST